MRMAFAKTLQELARENKNIMLLSGDLGYSLWEPFIEELPDQFLNTGVAEQSMVGVAAGMALSGKIVYTYSIVPFMVFRPFEHIRDDIAYHNLPVRVVGTGSGFSYGDFGTTHHSIEDIALMRSLPNMTVVAPGDPVEAELLCRASAAHPGPMYIRLAKRGEPVIHEALPAFEIGKAIPVCEGGDATLIACGALLACARDAAHILKRSGIHARVLSMHTIKPLDHEAIMRSARETGAVVTIEEHSIIGGLGSAVAEVLAESAANPLFRRIGVRDVFSHTVGDQAWLRDFHGLTAEKIAEEVLRLLT